MSSSIRAQMFASLGAENWGTDKVDFELARFFSKLSVEAIEVSSGGGGVKMKKVDLEDDRSVLTPSPLLQPSLPHELAPTGKENKIGLGKIIRNKRQKRVLKRFSLETIFEEE